MTTKVNRCNDLTGKEWLQNSFSIWRDLRKTKEEKEFLHPASFPVALVEKLLATFSREGDTVLDPFNGIGSTMVGAINTNRKGIGIDLSKEYCEIAKKRVGDAGTIRIINGNSFTELDKLEKNSCNLCITSPPYWDIIEKKAKDPENACGLTKISKVEPAGGTISLWDLIELGQHYKRNYELRKGHHISYI